METNVADPQETGGTIGNSYSLGDLFEMVSLRDPFFPMVGC